MSKLRVAIFQEIFANRNRRGPHSFFPTLVASYQKQKNTRCEVFLFVRTDNVEQLKKEYPEYLLHDHVVFLETYNNRFKKILENADLLWKLIKLRIGVLHTLSYSLDHGPTPALKFLVKWRVFLKTKLAFLVTYPRIPEAYANNFQGAFSNDIKYKIIFNSVRFDGMYAWYDDFIEWAKQSGEFPQNPLFKCIDSRFCDIEKYRPLEKKKQIVWASALVDFKRPVMFVEALDCVNKERPELLRDFEVVMYGSGPLEEEVRSAMGRAGLESMMTLHTNVNNMAPVVNHSMIYVSTQSSENFPSLAMNEAMAAGNVIIACNVGRTYLFVKDGKNGLLAKSDDVRGMADVMIECLKNPHNWPAMMAYSRELCETVHTPENFIKELEDFWIELSK